MNNTLANGFMLLEYLSGTAREYSIKELAEHFQLPNSHICRLLKSLKEMGYLEQSKSRKYRVSLKVLCLSNALLGKHQLRNRIRPYLQKLMMTLQTKTYLVQPMNGRSLTLDVIYPLSEQIDVLHEIGHINPVNVTATGKLCAAFMAESEYERIIVESKPEKFTPHSITDTVELMEELRRTRERGLAIADREHYQNVFSVAAPVFDCNGGFIGGIATNDWEVFEERKQEIISETREAAIAASFAMGYVNDYKINTYNRVLEKKEGKNGKSGVSQYESYYR